MFTLIPDINRLPEEVLVDIFLLCGKQTRWPHGRYPHICLSSVCRHWRGIINGSGVFWTVILFSPWKGKEFIHELVSRSRSIKLSVFAPTDTDLDIARDMHRVEEIGTVFDQLLETEGHRINFLFVAEDTYRILPRILSGKELPALSTFIFDQPHSRHVESKPLIESKEALSIIKSAKHLEFLDISLSNRSSLSGLGPSFFHRLRGLHIHLENAPIAKQFFDSIGLCSNLELLTVVTRDNSPIAWGPSRLPPITVFPNLISLRAECLTLLSQIRAPALRRLHIGNMNRPELGPQPAQRNYVIFDEYDLSSIIYLSVYETSHPQPNTTVSIYGASRSKTRHSYDGTTPSNIFQEAHNQQIDLGGQIIPSAFPDIPVEFSLDAQIYHKNSNGTIAPGSQHSFLSKMLPKLHHLEIFFLTFGFISCTELLLPFPPVSLFTPLKRLLKEIFDNFVSTNLRWLVISEPQMHPGVLRVIFDALNSRCSPLPRLHMITFRICAAEHPNCDCSIVGDALGEQLMKFLRLRLKAGHQPLKTFELAGYSSLPEKWITEAATLGTEIVEVFERDEPSVF